MQKVLTIASLLDAGVTTPDRTYPIGPTITIGEHTVSDAFKHGDIDITTRGILVKSSNVGAITAARDLTPAQLRGYLAGFGLGQKANLGLPGESAGSLPGAGMPQFQADSMAYGYGLSTSAVQMAAAIGAVANDGVYTAPSIIKASGPHNGALTPVAEPVSRRVVSEEAARATVEMMEQRTLDSEGAAEHPRLPDRHQDRYRPPDGRHRRLRGPGRLHRRRRPRRGPADPRVRPHRPPRHHGRRPRHGRPGVPRHHVAGPPALRCPAQQRHRAGQAPALQGMMRPVTTDTVLRPAAAPGVPLAQLVPGASGVLTGVALDSRQVRPGDLYVGLPGARHARGPLRGAGRGRRGALALLTDAAGAALAAGTGLPVVVVDDPRAAMAALAADVYGRPGDAVDLFGVTGTNGKTSVTVFLLEAALGALGRRVATIGTIGFRVAGRPLPGTRTTITTPESPDLQALLAVMREAGADTIAMEVSSHALALHRVDALTFGAAAFTMFGQDHLEFHHTLEEYFAAKTALFLDGHTRNAVVNTDDAWGRRLADLVRADGTARLVDHARRRRRLPRPVGRAAARRRVARHARPPRRRDDASTSRCSATSTSPTPSPRSPWCAPPASTWTPPPPGWPPPRSPDACSASTSGRTPRTSWSTSPTRPRPSRPRWRRCRRTGRRIAVLGAGGDRDATKRGPMGAAAPPRRPTSWS